MAIFDEETKPEKVKIWNLKNGIFSVCPAPFLAPKMGFRQNPLNFHKTTLQQAYKPKMAIFGEETHPVAWKMWNFKKMAYFWYTARRFWTQKWDFAKIIKTSTKQLYNKPKNQKWQYLVKKRTLHSEKCEISKNGIFSVHSAPFLAPKMGFRQNC